MKLRLLRQNTTLKADSKELFFNDGICEVEKITKDIQSLIDAGYIENIKEGKNGKSANKQK